VPWLVRSSSALRPWPAPRAWAHGGSTSDCSPAQGSKGARGGAHGGVRGRSAAGRPGGAVVGGARGKGHRCNSLK
jgi:hypothetical protein